MDHHDPAAGRRVGRWRFALAADDSEADRVGKVTKLSLKGCIFETWEGTLDRPYLPNDPGVGVATRIRQFCVPGDAAVARRRIDDAIAGDDRANVRHREKHLRTPWMGGAVRFVYPAERAGRLRQR